MPYYVDWAATDSLGGCLMTLLGFILIVLVIGLVVFVVFELPIIIIDHYFGNQEVVLSKGEVFLNDLR